jgi:hypothetical protein
VRAPEPEWLASSRGTTVFRDDGGKYSTFTLSEILDGVRSTLRKEAPEWFTDDFIPVGGLLCGDAILMKDNQLFLADTEMWPPPLYALRLTKEEFLELIKLRHPELDDIIYDSREFNSDTPLPGL